jgi:protein-S-isoprenylcysteine O-methyltransferase Ste14
MTEFELFGPVDSVLGSTIAGEVLVIEVLLLGLVVANMAARARAHSRHVEQAADGGAEAISRHPLHVGLNVLLMLGAFYYLTLATHAGMVASVLVLGVLLTDVFEFESRKVEARRDLELDRPKASVVSSLLVLVYLGYVTFFSGPLGQFL